MPRGGRHAAVPGDTPQYDTLVDPGVTRAIVVVLDACGVGELPDAADYGDAGSNTLAHLASEVGGLVLPTMQSLGLGSIVPIAGEAPEVGPAVDGRLRPLGPGHEPTPLDG